MTVRCSLLDVVMPFVPRPSGEQHILFVACVSKGAVHVGANELLMVDVHEMH